MNSRQRLLNCIFHKPVDRVPVSTYELVGWNSNSWENKEPSYKRLMDIIRKHTDCVYMMNPEFKQSSTPPSTEIKAWDSGEKHFEKVVHHTPKGDLEAVYRNDKGIYTTWTLEHFLKDVEDIDKYLSMPYEAPVVDMSEFYREKDKLGDKGLMMISLGDPICQAASLFEMGMFLVCAVTQTTRIKHFLDALFERQYHMMLQILKNDIENVIFRICGPEYATPPYLPPKLFYEFVTVYLIKMCREIRNAGGIPRIHCHGKIGSVIDQFAMTEAMAIDPIEPPPDGDIELAAVKKEYGDKFCLFGNIELKELELSPKEHIDSIVKSCMDAAKQGGGYVLMPTAAPINIPLSSKTEENYIQMIKSALEYGKY